MSEEDRESDDVALVCGATPDGETLGVLRKRGESLEAAVLKRAAEGQPVHGELVRLKARAESPLFDVEVLHAPRNRPAQVASKGYRKGWDRLFGKRSTAN